MSQCFARLGAESSSIQSTADMGTVEWLVTLTHQVRDTYGKLRLDSALHLAEIATALGRLPPDAKIPRLKPLLESRTVLSTLYREEADRTVKTALAVALSAIHRELHALLKPDELARSRATQKYREKNPAANAAAEAIVIYPTDHQSAKGQVSP